MNWRRANRHLFYKREAHIEEKVRETYIVGDMAVIPCKVEGYNDIISRYSVPGYETLNPEFMAHVQDVLRFIPSEYPVLLNVTESSFTEEQKDCIRRTIQADTLYELGAIQTEGKDLRQKLKYMLAGLTGMAVFLTVLNQLSGIPREFFYIVFWFFADFVISYLLWDRREYREELILAGRMASMNVLFSDHFSPEEITDEQKAMVYRKLRE